MTFSYDNIVGTIKLLFIILINRGRLSVKGLIRFSRTASIKVRRGGKITVGNHSSLSSHSVISATENAFLKIGDNSGVNYNSIIIARKSIIIGNNVLIGPNVAIYDHGHIFNDSEKPMSRCGYNTSPIVIEDNVWIGANVVILKGVTIGSGSVIGAGCVITNDIAPNSLVICNRDLSITEIKRKPSIGN